MVLELRYCLAGDGKSPFENWYADLNDPTAAKVTLALERLRQGNTSNAKGVGEGVLEYRIDWGPGYRVYFGRDGGMLVILLTGGTSSAGARHRAKEFWVDYRRRKPPAR